MVMSREHADAHGIMIELLTMLFDAVERGDVSWPTVNNRLMELEHEELRHTLGVMTGCFAGALSAYTELAGLDRDRFIRDLALERFRG